MASLGVFNALLLLPAMMTLQHNFSQNILSHLDKGRVTASVKLLLSPVSLLGIVPITSCLVMGHNGKFLQWGHRQKIIFFLQ